MGRQLLDLVTQIQADAQRAADHERADEQKQAGVDFLAEQVENALSCQRSGIARSASLAPAVLASIHTAEAAMAPRIVPGIDQPMAVIRG